jgi:hypothetical protein
MTVKPIVTCVGWSLCGALAGLEGGSTYRGNYSQDRNLLYGPRAVIVLEYGARFDTNGFQPTENFAF